MDNAEASPMALREPQHRLTIRLTTEELPDFKRILTAATKFGTIEGVSYDYY